MAKEYDLGSGVGKMRSCDEFFEWREEEKNKSRDRAIQDITSMAKEIECNGYVNYSPIEEALAYSVLLIEYDLEIETVSKILSKSVTDITNTIGLLELSSDVQNMVMERKLSKEHAFLLRGIKDEKQQNNVAKRIINEDLSIQDTE